MYKVKEPDGWVFPEIYKSQQIAQGTMIAKALAIISFPSWMIRGVSMIVISAHLTMNSTLGSEYLNWV